MNLHFIANRTFLRSKVCTVCGTKQPIHAFLSGGQNRETPAWVRDARQEWNICYFCRRCAADPDYERQMKNWEASLRRMMTGGGGPTGGGRY